MIDRSTVRGRIVAAALDLAAQRPWDKVTLRDIAEAAGSNLVELRREFRSKGEILAAFARMIDDEVLAKAPARTPGQAARDHLFEVLMSRFDALQAYRPALKSIAAAAQPDPALMRAFLGSQAWMLHAAGIGTDGIEGGLKLAGLASIYASVFRTWLDDDDPGLARTMAALDRRLRRAERSYTTIEDGLGLVRRFVAMVSPSVRPSRSPPPAGADENPAPTPDPVV